jgi:hypothetical protein
MSDGYDATLTLVREIDPFVPNEPPKPWPKALKAAAIELSTRLARQRDEAIRSAHLMAGVNLAHGLERLKREHGL